MRTLRRNMAIGAVQALVLLMAACGGGGSSNKSTPFVLTVNSTSPVSGVAIAVSPADSNGATSGTTSFTRTYISGTAVTLTASAASGNESFVSWSGCTSGTGATCNVTMSANATVTANYQATPKPTPAITVTPSAQAITVAQPLTVAVALTSVSGGITPTGTVTLTSGSYTAAATLTNGNATISVVAGSLPVGNDVLTVAYAPDSTSSSIYSGGTATASVTVTPVGSAVLTVNSTSPASGVAISLTPADSNGATGGNTSFVRVYNPGTVVTLTAPATAGTSSFVSWNGCTQANTVVCSVAMNANTTITVNYVVNEITSITVTPSTAVIGTTVQFTATVNGTGTFKNGVTWSLAGPAGSTLSPGTLSATGLYTTPYPAPPTVTVTATSTQDSTKSGTVAVALNAPAIAAGPTLSVDAGNKTHAISPYIYGMNAYSLNATAAKAANLSLARWGGDNTSRYNYQLNASNSASDYYFENSSGAANVGPTGNFDDLVTSDNTIDAATLGTVPVLGWVAKDTTSCSYPVSTYPDQYSIDSNRGCGDGETPNQADITGVAATVTSVAAGPAWAGDWVTYLVNKFGNAASSKGVAIYDLDNEPTWWDAEHRDVHPVASTYDEVTNNGIATALAVKTADPTAAVSGPVVDYWWNYFYSKKDIESGWNSGGPCYEQWSNPVDRIAHNGTPFIEYYLQKFKAAEAANNMRLLDYLDLHTYFAATYNGASVSQGTAGDTGEQQARVNSTRVFWDSTYTDSNYLQPNYLTDANYTPSCTPPAQAPQLIPMMQAWVANDYPGTKTAITEYNWGGQESINGAVAQADILGIFASYGLDLGTLWGPPDPVKQVPGLMAFEIYRNYDGKNSTFGDTALASTSANQSQLSVYGGFRTADSAVTVVVINKTYGPLTSTLSLAHLTPNGAAQVFQYSDAHLAAIVVQPNVTVTAPPAGGTTSTVGLTFPGQSITLLVVPTL